jgi:hypothetical protein
MSVVDYLGRRLDDVFLEIRSAYPVMEFQKIEQDCFVEVPEAGFFVQARGGSETITDARVYRVAHGKYLGAEYALLGDFVGIPTLEACKREYGEPAKVIRSAPISDGRPTLPGMAFECGNRRLIAYSENMQDIVCFHLKLRSP